MPFKAFVTVFVALRFNLERQFTGGGQNQHTRTPFLVSGPERAKRHRFLYDSTHIRDSHKSFKQLNVPKDDKSLININKCESP